MNSPFRRHTAWKTKFTLRKKKFMRCRHTVPACVVLTLLTLLPTDAFAQTEDSPETPVASNQSANSSNPDRSDPQASAQNSAQTPVTCGLTHVGRCLKDLGHDEVGIWTSPLHIRPHDAYWLVPFAAATGVALHYDAQAQQELGIDQTRTDVSSAFSDVGLYGSIGGAAGLYLLGSAKHNNHLAETGRLGEEAIVNSLLVVEALKLATNRQRPNEGNGRGGFWPHGTRSFETDGSFPSAHAITTFAFARVIASEYPSKKVQLAAYAFALAVSASRVTAREHFPSDVLVGGMLGYLVGGYVIHHHATYGEAPAFNITPLVEQSTQTYGLHVEFTPGDFSLNKRGRFVGWLRSTR